MCTRRRREIDALERGERECALERGERECTQERERRWVHLKDRHIQRIDE